MPLYDYRCSNCDHEFEIQLRIADYELPLSSPCPNCKEIGNLEQFFPSAPGLGDSVSLGIRKPDRTFQRDIIGRMQKNIRRNNLGKGHFTIPGRSV